MSCFSPQILPPEPHWLAVHNPGLTGRVSYECSQCLLARGLPARLALHFLRVAFRGPKGQFVKLAGKVPLKVNLMSESCLLVVCAQEKIASPMTRKPKWEISKHKYLYIYIHIYIYIYRYTHTYIHPEP